MKNFNNRIILTFCFILVFNFSRAQGPYKVQVNYADSPIPPEPDYTLLKNWTALPTTEDMADEIPLRLNEEDGQGLAKADLFFIHPTIFTKKPTNEFKWNADVNDSKINAAVEKSTILNQTTAFNGSCRIYAPRYRQAHYSAFTTSNEDDATKSLALAYKDVKKAFEYYLENHNEGRPIVIASHSQGTIHAKRLLNDFFDGKPLQNQLVTAYLVGMPIRANEFENIIASNSPEHVGGFSSWNTFQKGYYPSYYEGGLHEAICTNPLTWKTDNTYASRKLNKGGVGLKFKFIKKPADAQVKDGLLWIHKPYVRGRIFIKTKIWHAADINLYWMNIRENVALRISQYLQEKPIDNEK